MRRSSMLQEQMTDAAFASADVFNLLPCNSDSPAVGPTTCAPTHDDNGTHFVDERVRRRSVTSASLAFSVNVFLIYHLAVGLRCWLLCWRPINHHLIIFQTIEKQLRAVRHPITRAFRLIRSLGIITVGYNFETGRNLHRGHSVPHKVSL